MYRNRPTAAVPMPEVTPGPPGKGNAANLKPLPDA